MFTWQMAVFEQAHVLGYTYVILRDPACIEPARQD